MSKIKYDTFESIISTMDNFTTITSSIESLISSINSLTVDILELSTALSGAKKTTILNLSNIKDLLQYNADRTKNICESYQIYENNKVSTNSLLNKEFKVYSSGSPIASQSTSYNIKSGDTLSKIAEKNDVTVEAIVDANKDKIKDKDLIHAGDSIIIPGAVAASASNEKKQENNVETKNKKEDKAESVANSENINGKYNNNINAGFEVTYNNKKYSLSSEEFDLLCAIVAAECDKTPDDALAVVSTILNRCENSAWVNSHGTNPISQATAPNQYVVYQHGIYKNYINGKAPESVKEAVKDALNGVRNCEYLSFRSNSSTAFSNNMISSTGNRYT